MERSEDYFLFDIHVEGAVDRGEYQQCSEDLYSYGESHDIEQGGDKRIHAARVDDVAKYELAVDRGATAEKQCEKGCESHDAESAELDQHGQYGEPERSECRGDIDRGQPGDAYSRCADEKSIHEIYPSDGRFREHQQECSENDENKEAHREKERGIGAPVHHPEDGVAQCHYGISDENGVEENRRVKHRFKPRNPWMYRPRIDYRQQRDQKRYIDSPFEPAVFFQRLRQIECQPENDICPENPLHGPENPADSLEPLRRMLVSDMDDETYNACERGDSRDHHQKLSYVVDDVGAPVKHASDCEADISASCLYSLYEACFFPGHDMNGFSLPYRML